MIPSRITRSPRVSAAAMPTAVNAAAHTRYGTHSQLQRRPSTASRVSGCVELDGERVAIEVAGAVAIVALAEWLDRDRVGGAHRDRLRDAARILAARRCVLARGVGGERCTAGIAEDQRERLERDRVGDTDLDLDCSAAGGCGELVPVLGIV